MGILALLGSTAVMLTTTDMKIGGNYKSSAQASAPPKPVLRNAIAPERFRCRIRLRRGYGGNRRSIVVDLYSDIRHLDHR